MYLLRHTLIATFLYAVLYSNAASVPTQNLPPILNRDDLEIKVRHSTQPCFAVYSFLRQLRDFDLHSNEWNNLPEYWEVNI